MLRRLHLRLALVLMALSLAGAWPSAQAEEIFTVNHGTVPGEGGTPLALSLLLPSAQDRPPGGWPAVLLLQGSGPTDRDGNQPPHIRTDLLRQTAEYLAEHGFATMRYDKRGMHGNSAALPQDPAQYPQFFRWENFVGDAAAAFRFLAGHPGINAVRVAIFGHSEGSVLALAAAQLLQATGSGPRALVLAAPPGRPLQEVLTEQLQRVLAEQKATPAQSRAVLDANRRIIDGILATGRVPENLPRSLAPLYPAYAGPFLQSLLPLDPAALARRTAMPALLLQGEADQQISTQRDMALLDQALAARSGAHHRVQTFPGLGHNFLMPAGPGGMADVSPAMLETLAEWLRERLPAD